MVSLGDVCRQKLGMQCQYGSRYADKQQCEDNPESYCGDGLRITGTTADYHGMKIHKDDVETFVSRVKAYKLSLSN